MTTVTTARNFSVMPVQVVGELRPIERAVQRCTSLMIGEICNVEFGATFATRGTQHYRVDGQWFACRILRHEGAIIYVELLPDVRLSGSVSTDIGCNCEEGWVCEDHPNRPLGHDGCDGAGKHCLNPQCPYWRGPDPLATRFDAPP